MDCNQLLFWLSQFGVAGGVGFIRKAA